MDVYFRTKPLLKFRDTTNVIDMTMSEDDFL